MNHEFRLATQEDFSSLAERVLSIAPHPASHCLHTWSGEDADGLIQGWTKSLGDGELVYLLAERDGRLMGALGCEFDLELQRGWLQGPHVFSDDWAFWAEALYAALEVPEVVHTFDAFLNVGNTRGREFFLSKGFQQRPGFVHEMKLPGLEFQGLGQTRCPSIVGKQRASFLKLYASAFPSSYYTGERILAMAKDAARVFVVAEGAEVLGFAVSTVDPGGVSGELEFLAVREDRQREGIGRRLLMTGIDWLVNEMGVSEVALTVLDEVANARDLYISVGFYPRFTGVAFRKGSAHAK